MTATSRLTTGLVLFLCTSGPAGAQTPPLLAGLPSIALQTTTSVSQSGAPTQSPSAGPGRVVVTIVSDSLRIPGVTVELRNVDGNIMVGQTISDAVGQVTFPDVPPGRYIVQRRARRVRRHRLRPLHGRPGRDRTGARRDAADVRPRERRRRRARQLADGEPAAGRGQRRADRREDGHPAARGRRLPVAADGAAEHHSRARRAACASRAARRRRARFR